MERGLEEAPCHVSDTRVRSGNVVIADWRRFVGYEYVLHTLRENGRFFVLHE